MIEERVVNVVKANFIINDYVLIWNLLFKASISEKIYNLKQKMWDVYKNEYHAIFNDKNEMLEDYKNYIPKDDTIYNIVMENDDYHYLKKRVEKYRLEVLNIWDKKKKETTQLYSKIVRLAIPDYTFFIVNKELNTIENPTDDTLIVGKEICKEDPIKLLIQINKEILKYHIHPKKENKNITDTIIELAVYNEYGTMLTKKSAYQFGDPQLFELKHYLYPYWLMYLGVPKEEFFSYMMRDKIVFEESQYAYEKELKKMNLEEFINFCIRNERYIVREHKKEVV